MSRFRKYSISSSIGLIFLFGCTVPVPCPLRINAGTNDPECQDTSTIAHEITAEDSAKLKSFIKLMNLPIEPFSNYFESDNNKHLKFIILIYQRIDTLPRQIGDFEGLVSLNLNSSHLKSLPPEIGKLKSLEELALSGNELDSLPSSLGLLFKLQVLSVDHNRLMDIPASLMDLHLLSSVSFDANPFCSTPPERLQWMTRIAKKTISKNPSCN